MAMTNSVGPPASFKKKPCMNLRESQVSWGHSVLGLFTASLWLGRLKGSALESREELVSACNRIVGLVDFNRLMRFAT